MYEHQVVGSVSDDCLSEISTLLYFTSTFDMCIINTSTNEKVPSQTQTVHASKAEPKIFALPLTASQGAGRPKFNLVEMVTTFSYKPSLVRIDARNFNRQDC